MHRPLPRRLDAQSETGSLMLRIVIMFFAVAFGVNAAAAEADPPARVGRLNYLSGAVSFSPAEASDEWRQAVVNRPLTSGDRLWVDHNARAELHVGSTAIRLAPLTSLDVLNLDDDTLQVRLAQGVINLRVRDLMRGEIVEVATPTGAVLIREAGSYRISVDAQTGVSRVMVNYGQAEVIAPTQTVTVPSSQSALISADTGIVFEPAPYGSGDKFERWAAQRDRAEDGAMASHYVSRDMTGYEDLDDNGSWRTLAEYGAVWVPSRVPSGWAPYRFGHWLWMSPWGWTWVDDASWGFAPFHYGRWVWLDESYWAWAPGPRMRRPVYAPALVAFIGGSSLSIAAKTGPAVGWFPLGWREPFIPWYRASTTYARNLNTSHRADVNTPHVNYVYRNRPAALTVVSQQTFASARPVAAAGITMPRSAIVSAEVIRERLAEPTHESLAVGRPGNAPPLQTLTRRVFAVNTPALPAARNGRAVPGYAAAVTPSAPSDARVRLPRERIDTDRNHTSQQQTAPQPRRAADTYAAPPTPLQTEPLAHVPPGARQPASTVTNAAPAAPAPIAAPVRNVPPNASAASAFRAPTAPLAVGMPPTSAPARDVPAQPSAVRPSAQGGPERQGARSAASGSTLSSEAHIAARERPDAYRPPLQLPETRRESAGSQHQLAAERGQNLPVQRETRTRPAFVIPQAAAPLSRITETPPPREAPSPRPASSSPRAIPSATSQTPLAPPTSPVPRGAAPERTQPHDGKHRAERAAAP